MYGKHYPMHAHSMTYSIFFWNFKYFSLISMDDYKFSHWEIMRMHINIIRKPFAISCDRKFSLHELSREIPSNLFCLMLRVSLCIESSWYALSKSPSYRNIFMIYISLWMWVQTLIGECLWVSFTVIIWWIFNESA